MGPKLLSSKSYIHYSHLFLLTVNFGIPLFVFVCYLLILSRLGRETFQEALTLLKSGATIDLHSSHFSAYLRFIALDSPLPQGACENPIFEYRIRTLIEHIPTDHAFVVSANLILSLSFDSQGQLQINCNVQALII